MSETLPISYRFIPSDPGISEGVKRIALGELRTALAELHDDTLTDPKRVHVVRKHMKKLRGLIRLIRSGFRDYRAENAAYRDAARLLSELRDGDVLIATYDTLCAHYKGSINRRRFSSIRRVLTWRTKQRWASDDIRDRLATFEKEVRAAEKRVAKWKLRDKGFKTMAAGIENLYGRARFAMSVAETAPTEPNMHEWRKRVKYHWYHARLLKPMAPGVMKPHIALAARLSDVLGDHHDLDVFLDELPGIAKRAKSADIAGFRRLIRKRRKELEVEAFDLGRQLLSEDPDELTARWKPLWDAWRMSNSARVPEAALQASA